MEQRDETDPHKLNKQKYQKKMDDGSSTTSYHRFPNSILKNRPNLSQRSRTGKPLDVLLRDQNQLIERLRDDLNQEKSVVQSLRKLCHRSSTFCERKYQKKSDEGSPQSYRRFANSAFKQHHVSFNQRSSRSSQQLEVLIKEQNQLIERLRDDLNQEKSVVQSLREQCLRSTIAEEELHRVKVFLSDRGLEQLTEEGFLSFKAQLEQNLCLRFEETVQNLKLQHKKDVEKLKSWYKEEIDTLKEVKDNDLSLVKEINIFQEYLSAFKCTTAEVRDVGESASKDAIERVINDLDQLNIRCQHFSTAALDICQAFSESVREEMLAKSKLLDLKTSQSLTDQYSQTAKTTFETSAIGDVKFVQLQHSRHICNHDKEVSLLSDVPGETLKLTADEKPSALICSTDNDHLLNYIAKLNKYIKDMVNFYKSKVFKVSNKKESSSELSDSAETFDDSPLNSDQTSSQEGNIINVKECHKMIFALNEILKSFDFHLNDALKKNRLLEGDINLLKKNHIEKSHSLESHVKLLNEKIVNCLRENRTLESKLQELISGMVTKEQYDLLEKEKDKLAEANAMLEKEVQTLKEEGKSPDKLPVEQSVERNAIGDCRNQTTNTDDSSINYENLIPAAVATSTPFQPRLVEEESQAPLTLDLMKSSLFEWIQRCQNLESDKRQLEQKLHNLNFLCGEANFRKNVLEQEVTLLKNNTKCLEDKFKDYITLREKCYKLENDNTILIIQNKYFDKLLNFKGNNNEENELPHMIKFDSKLCSSVFHTPESAFNCIDDFQKRNQKIIYLESKCRANDAKINKLNLELEHSKELENSLKTKLEDLIRDNLKMYEKLSSLLEDYTQVNLKKQESEIELETVKDRLKYLISLANVFKDDTRNSLVEAMKEDAMKFLKDCIEKWSESKMTQMSGDALGLNVDKLDARHCLDVLVQDNNLLRDDKEELLMRLSSLQLKFHELQKSSDAVDSGWYTQLDKYERELAAEIKEQRKLHEKTEEALRSTVPLQKLLDLKFKEKADLERRLAEEKQKIKCYEAETSLLNLELKEKEKILLEVIEEKKAIQSKLAEVEKDFTVKFKNFETDLFKVKWTSRFQLNKSVATQVKDGLLKLCKEVSDQESQSEKEEEEVKCERKALDEVFTASLTNLRYLLQEENSRALAQAASTHTHQVNPTPSLQPALPP